MENQNNSLNGQRQDTNFKAVLIKVFDISVSKVLIIAIPDELTNADCESSFKQIKVLLCYVKLQLFKVANIHSLPTLMEMSTHPITLHLLHFNPLNLY
jgi:hypothetical protein